jgi:hypothetical protein
MIALPSASPYHDALLFLWQAYVRCYPEATYLAPRCVEIDATPGDEALRLFFSHGDAHVDIVVSDTDADDDDAPAWRIQCTCYRVHSYEYYQDEFDATSGVPDAVIVLLHVVASGTDHQQATP